MAGFKLRLISRIKTVSSLKSLSEATTTATATVATTPTVATTATVATSPSVATTPTAAATMATTAEACSQNLRNLDVDQQHPLSLKKHDSAITINFYSVASNDANYASLSIAMA